MYIKYSSETAVLVGYSGKVSAHPLDIQPQTPFLPGYNAPSDFSVENELVHWLDLAKNYLFVKFLWFLLED